MGGLRNYLFNLLKPSSAIDATLAQKSSNFQSGDFPYVLWRYIPSEIRIKVAKILPEINSQYGQDLFVFCCAESCNIQSFFIEAGATNGLNWSNTYLLEKFLGWNGVLVEPCRSFHKDLRRNRVASIETRCLLSSDNIRVSFTEVLSSSNEHMISSPELSSVSSFLPDDWASKVRSQNSIVYDVQTISFTSLAKTHGFEGHLGYLSLDTEGSEVDILDSIDFTSFTFDIITVEHNHIPSRIEKIKTILAPHGYISVLEDASNADL